MQRLRNANTCTTRMTMHHQGVAKAPLKKGEVFYPINPLSAYFQSYRVAEGERINSDNLHGRMTEHRGEIRELLKKE